MPATATGPAPDSYRHGHRTAWIVYVVTLIVAGGFHASKAADERGAFIRWRHQVWEFWDGVNIWDRYAFPNPPILPIIMTPLMALPPVTGAMAWFALKASLACGCLLLCIRMARGSDRAFPPWALFLVMVLSLRPILSDLHHGNNNLLILALIVGALYAWRRGWDVLAGLTLALAITFKVTPALFVPYFLYKRSWRMVGATLLGIGVFLLIVPSVALGPEFNGQCLAMWWHRMLRPFVSKGFISPQEVNQSLMGVITRLLTALPEAEKHGYHGVQVAVNVVSWDPQLVGRIIKGLSLAMVGLLALFCRTKTTRRDDSRLFGEFALVVLTMLIVSERSWKHHYVTILLPTTYLVHRMGLAPAPRRVRIALGGALALASLMMATTSSELGVLFPPRPDAAGKEVAGHKVALAYGMFLWAGVMLYVATAWRVVVEGRRTETATAIPAPHLRPQNTPSPTRRAAT